MRQQNEPKVTVEKITGENRGAENREGENESFQAATIARLEALMEKHQAGPFRHWKVDRDDAGARPVLRLASRLIVAAFAPVLERMKIPEVESLLETSSRMEYYLHGDTRRARQARRNERLLLRLIVTGCRRRGELPRPQPEPMIVPEGTVAVKVKGDEMEPKYHAGEFVYIVPGGKVWGVYRPE